MSVIIFMLKSNRIKRVNFLGKKEKTTERNLNDNGYIGVIIFAIIFIYLIYHVFTYFTEVHIAKYEVLQGTMASNNIYKGFVLRDETVFKSEYSGAVNYYIKDYAKVGFNDLVYSVDENGSISDKLNEVKNNGVTISDTTSEEIIKFLDAFETAYSNEEFYHIYTLKEQVNSLLNEAISLDALAQISDYADHAEQNQTFHRVRAKEDGVISYYIDGYENVTLDTFRAEMLDEASYKRNNLKANLEINAGGDAYKLINSEHWKIILPITKELKWQMEQDDDSIVRIRFVKDAKEMYAEYELLEQEGHSYMILSLKNAMVRYIADRFVEVELLLAEETGLKIPNTAITEKEFYTIPIEYFLKGDDGSADGLLIERIDKEGVSKSEFIDPTIYYETEDFYYIDSELVKAGDYIVLQDSQSRYRIGDDTATLKGVYNINKGYAVFKQIEIVYQNEEYTLVKTGTSYGIALYDHIALDATKIQEDELIK